MPDIDRLAGANGGERRRPPARQQQQPGADRTVETREPQIRPHPVRREAVDPVSGGIGDASGRLAHRAKGLPVRVSIGAAAGLPASVRGTFSGRAERIAQAWAGGLLGRRRADGIPDLHGAAALVLDVLDGLRRHAAARPDRFEGFDHSAFGGEEVLEQLASLRGGGLLLFGGVDSAGVFLRLVAQGQQLLTLGRRRRRLLGLRLRGSRNPGPPASRACRRIAPAPASQASTTRSAPKHGEAS